MYATAIMFTFLIWCVYNKRTHIGCWWGAQRVAWRMYPNREDSIRRAQFARQYTVNLLRSHGVRVK